MAYLRTVLALIVCKEASPFGGASCSDTAVSTFYELRDIELFCLSSPINRRSE